MTSSIDIDNGANPNPQPIMSTSQNLLNQNSEVTSAPVQEITSVTIVTNTATAPQSSDNLILHPQQETEINEDQSSSSQLSQSTIITVGNNPHGSNELPLLKPPDYGSLPPDYHTATELPSYEEAERIKREGGEFLPPPPPPQLNINSASNINNQFPSLLIFSDVDGVTSPVNNGNVSQNANYRPLIRDIDFLNAILGTQSNINRNANTLEGDPNLEANTHSTRHNRFPFSLAFQEWRHNTSDVIGSDTAFLTSFLISFIFNWIGFLFALCVSQTIAGRCGALSGFGLSIIKWTFIVKHSLNYASAEIWLWWILIILGALLFCKGCIQYLQSRPFAVR